jgi:hypothetical protein
MANELNSVVLIANHIAECFDNIPAGVSGNMIEIVDNTRTLVQNFTGQTINGSSIDEKYQHAILNYSKADVIDLTNSQAGGDDVRLGELSVSSSSEQMSADQYRKLGENSLKYLGRHVQSVQTIA